MILEKIFHLFKKIIAKGIKLYPAKCGIYQPEQSEQLFLISFKSYEISILILLVGYLDIEII